MFVRFLFPSTLFGERSEYDGDNDDMNHRKKGEENMITANKDIRMAMYRYRVTNWKLADALGISEATFSRRIRYELPKDVKREYMEAIKRVARENGMDE